MADLEKLVHNKLQGEVLKVMTNVVNRMQYFVSLCDKSHILTIYHDQASKSEMDQSDFASEQRYFKGNIRLESVSKGYKMTVAEDSGRGDWATPSKGEMR